MATQYILALDQGTGGSAALLFDANGSVVAAAECAVAARHPQPGWVEQDAHELVQATQAAATHALAEAGARWSDVAAIGIANQRETTVVWDRRSGEPLGPAIVWQCRRTAPLCAELERGGWGARVRRATGLPIDPYFAATKIRWLLDHTPQGQQRAMDGELLAGTVDTWLLWNLTADHRHATDYTNASRTLLFDIHERRWDADLLGMLNIPPALLPEVQPSAGLFGTTPEGVPVLAMAGDQQAALFGQGCFDAGQAKHTYGTGAFLLMNTGVHPSASERGLLTTLAIDGQGQPCYALEGSVLNAGSVVQWLRDGLGIIQTAEETEALALSVQDTAGLVLVPAFSGLGSPYWDPTARGTLLGVTAAAGRAHLVRAALEAQAFQTAELLQAILAEAPTSLAALRVDGGGSANNFTMQFQADLLGLPVERPTVHETTAQGAAFLAGLAAGIWPDAATLRAMWRLERRFEPAMAATRRAELLATWRRAIQRSLHWAEDAPPSA